ncbi:hypothetical protein RRU94_19105 [Domibacillus sp. DTU_2020_1001157_1_SI_ALB_TIR_016]|uniref:hypothetical protein n=1 Tax=Domibacillus sp. DTU_2020_1001157_1_SI_ALB_TIR_016 TaxID=3077789 RepID=UPI0028F0DC6E|nr:hypothetical protein [Domibacillus sp. DTU_2020_1001157_1_SI_ALB_TIR_016]WNS79631.1 hypothetical protein RRU94_19105 [Domibacillus sp. DTU_2020_1001157_1_SI_ALB_TIR_016]
MVKLKFFLYMFFIYFAAMVCYLILHNEASTKTFSELAGEEIIKFTIIGIIILSASFLFGDLYNERFKEIRRSIRIILFLLSLFASVVTAILLMGDYLIK